MNNIKYFGNLDEIIRDRNMNFNFPMNLKTFKNELLQKNIELQNCIFAIAVNNNIIKDENFILNIDDEIALLPPFSGG